MSSEFAELVVEKLIPREPHEGFSSRNAEITDEIRLRLLGTVAAIGGLAEDEPTLMGQRINQLYEANADDITLFGAIKSLDHYLYNTVWRYDGERREDHQVEVLHDVLDSLSAGEQASHYELATSSGKNLIMAKLTEAFYKGGLRSLSLAPSVTIANQLIGKGINKGLERFTRDIDLGIIGRNFGGRQAKASDKIVVSTYQSLIKFAADGRLGEFDVMLGDEAHHATGTKTMDALKRFSPHAVRLGFSATPDYGKNKGAFQVFGEKRHELSLRRAIETDITAPVQCLTFETGETIRNLDPGFSDFSERELERLYSLKARNGKALEFAKAFIEEGRQGIIACVPGSNMAHPKLMTKLLSELQVKDAMTGEMRSVIAKSVGSHLTQEENKKILEEYEQGSIDVLTSVNMLAEGWDSDQASFLINLCPTTSVVKLTQLIGRVIRKKKNGLRAIVVDFVDQAVGKKQVTALQVLGEETVNMGLVFSSRSEEQSGEPAETYLRGILSEDLYARLAANNGRLISDLTIPPSKESERRKTAYFEKLLEREGMPADVHLMGVPSTLRNGIREAEEWYLATENRLPTVDDVIDYLVDLGHVPPVKGRQTARKALQMHAIGMGGLLLNLADQEPGMIHGDPSITIVNKTEQSWLQDGWMQLDHREQAILERRFGLLDGQVRTLEAIGEEMKVTGHRIQQIEAKAMSKLRQFEFGGRIPIRSSLEKPVDGVLLTGDEIARMPYAAAKRYITRLNVLAETHRAYGDALDETDQALLRHVRLRYKDAEIFPFHHSSITSSVNQLFANKKHVSMSDRLGFARYIAANTDLIKSLSQTVVDKSYYGGILIDTSRLRQILKENYEAYQAMPEESKLFFSRVLSASSPGSLKEAAESMRPYYEKRDWLASRLASTIADNVINSLDEEGMHVRNSDIVSQTMSELTRSADRIFQRHIVYDGEERLQYWQQLASTLGKDLDFLRLTGRLKLESQQIIESEKLTNKHKYFNDNAWPRTEPMLKATLLEWVMLAEATLDRMVRGADR